MTYSETLACHSRGTTQCFIDSINIEADVIVVDKSLNHGPYPYVYQLPEQLFGPSINLLELRQRLNERDHQFIFLGEARHIGKQAKKLFLCNGGMVSYKYFIELIGTDTPILAQSDAFLPSLECLGEALRIQSSIHVPKPTKLLGSKWHHYTRRYAPHTRRGIPSPTAHTPYKSNADRLTCGKRFHLEV